MIISRTPFRISFIGGSSDMAEFYQRHPGCVLSTTINKYMYISIHPYFFDSNMQLKYSRTEIVEHYKDIIHPIFRAVLERFGVSGVEIDSIADIPASTGLGSSSAFTVGLLHTLYAYTGNYMSHERLAEEACDIEIRILGEPIGKQDQYASAFGGLNLINFYSDERVSVEPVIIPHGKQHELERNLMLFYTGRTRPAASILSEQRQNIINNEFVFDILIQMVEMARELRAKLSMGDIDYLGKVLHNGWLLKQQLAPGINNELISKYYDLSLNSGAIGGKLLGAGGGGFLLLYVYPDAQSRVRRTLKDLHEMEFSFDNGGTKIIYVGDNR